MRTQTSHLAVLAMASAVPFASGQCPPASPGGLDASDGDFCNSIALSWNAPPGGGVSWYEVWRSTGTTFAQANRIATGIVLTNYTDVNVSTGTYYSYWITAWNLACLPGNNRSAPSARNQGLANAPALPMVTNFVATPGCGRVEFSWPAVPGVGITYSVQRFAEGDFGYANIGNTTPLLHFTDSSPPDAVCAYRVIALPPPLVCNVSSEPTEILGVRCHTTSPSSPTAAVATDGTRCGRVMVSWESVGSEADTYQIWRAPPGGGAAPLATVNWNAPSYMDTTAAPGVVYTYVVRASNICGVSGGAIDTGFAPCRSDFNCSGGVSIDDIFVFLNAWFAGCDGSQTGAPCNGRSADFDGVGGVAINDIFAFLNAWFAGC